MLEIRPLSTVVVAGLLVLLGACGAGHPSAPPTHEASVGAMGDRAVPPQAPEVLAAAIGTVMSSGRYRQTVAVAGLDEPYYEVTGRYDLARQRFTADLAFWNSEAGETRTLRHVFTGSRGFQQAEGWRGRATGCWLVFDADRSAQASRLTDAGPTTAPAAVLALDGAVEEPSSGPPDRTIEGRIELQKVATLMQPAFVRQAPVRVEGSVPATFHVDGDGSLVRWQVDGADVVAAVARTGEGSDGSGLGVAEGLDTFTLTVSYDALGEPVDVRAPARALWMSPRALELHRGCGQG